MHANKTPTKQGLNTEPAHSLLPDSLLPLSSSWDAHLPPLFPPSPFGSPFVNFPPLTFFCIDQSSKICLPHPQHLGNGVGAASTGRQMD